MSMRKALVAGEGRDKKPVKTREKPGKSIVELGGDRLFAGNIFVDMSNPVFNGATLINGFLDRLHEAGYLGTPVPVTDKEYDVVLVRIKETPKDYNPQSRVFEEYAPGIISGNLKLRTQGLENVAEYVGPIQDALALKEYTPLCCAVGGTHHEINFYKNWRED